MPDNVRRVVTAEEIRPIITAIAKQRGRHFKHGPNGLEEISEREWVDGMVDTLAGTGIRHAYGRIDNLLDTVTP